MTSELGMGISPGLGTLWSKALMGTRRTVQEWVCEVTGAKLGCHVKKLSLAIVVTENDVGR